MANKYTALKIPPKTELEELYHSQFKSQKEIGELYNTTQKVVFSWFKKLGINSRVAYKRDQKGPKNHSWKNSGLTYSAYHYRVQSSRGKAYKCEECGRSDSGTLYDWANLTGNYQDIMDYKMMCRSCHFKMDQVGKNLPNNFFSPNPNKRKIINGQLK